jgi:hypothetical protein
MNCAVIWYPEMMLAALKKMVDINNMNLNSLAFALFLLHPEWQQYRDIFNTVAPMTEYLKKE